MKKRYQNIILTIAALLVISIITGCGVYSFTGASIPPEAETMTVKYFSNKSDLVKPTLSQQFTEELRDKFSSQTTLSLVERGGDLALEGEIVEYSTKPIAIQGNERAAQNRLTIGVNVRFTNKYDEDANFETKFSRYADYDSQQRLSAVEESLISQINEQLVEDIFNKAVVNW
ncbi:MAG: hypothetical protein K9I94_09905 [Bacteroidales bacterium]|nr:hypothetical protein [Bacteroidales bacterium]